MNEEKLNAFAGQVVEEIGATFNAGLVVIGDKLGLYRALAGAGPLTPGELAHSTDTRERFVREWLNAQAAGGYVEYDPAGGTYELPPEQAAALADETSPAFVCGAFQLATSTIKDEPRIREAFRTGTDFGWHEHHHDMFEGCERFFRPGYAANLISAWLPALDDVDEKLRAGASVADVGCGHGASTILMAQRYPSSHFVGFDYHAESIEQANERARSLGIGDRLRFVVAPAKKYPGSSYELVTMFDCLHDMGDPVGAARHVLESLAPDGTWLIVEPFANTTTSRRTSTPSVASTTAPPRRFAPRARSPRRSGSHSARRRARRESARWSRAQASRAAGVRPRRRSTSSSRRGRRYAGRIGQRRSPAPHRHAATGGDDGDLEKPFDGPVRVGGLNLDGDRQADLTVHGGAQGGLPDRSGSGRPRRRWASATASASARPSST
jgi:2-polyprenyl-3-methyl-5-hydroxy-6-metoxy-1,4-benzoquinol methylase